MNYSLNSRVSFYHLFFNQIFFEPLMMINSVLYSNLIFIVKQLICSLSSNKPYHLLISVLFASKYYSILLCNDADHIKAQ